MKQIHTLVNTLEWFQQAVPEPDKQNMSTQLGVHFEEISEMLSTIEISDDESGSAILLHATMSMVHLANYLKKNQVNLVLNTPVLFLDSLCDQIVTATGVGHMFNMEIIEALDEVNASNFSKFVDGIPIFDANQKVIKGPDYHKPNLEPFVPKE